MTSTLGKSRWVLALSAYLLGLVLSRISSKFCSTLEASVWTMVEIAIALAIAVVMGLIAVFISHQRSVRLLDLAVSRGLEVTAALPIVLLCSVIVATFGWKMPFSVALVVGTLNGLMCLRMMTLGRRDVAMRAPFARFKRALQASINEMVPQLVGLEAAIVFLGMFDVTSQGGLGGALGMALMHNNYKDIIHLTFVCVGLSVGLHRLLHPPKGTPPSVPV
jgi:ABC-type dipeptide/oligopeptide/nickel transport system permease subunit